MLTLNKVHSQKLLLEFLTWLSYEILANCAILIK